MSEAEPTDNAMHLSAGAWIEPADVTWSFSRSRGPGGQSVNKTSSRAELRVAVADVRGLGAAARRRLRRLAGQRLTAEDELLIASDTHRSQARNRAACVERLSELVEAAANPPPPRRKTRPTRASVRRRIEQKKQRGEKKQRRKPPDY